MKKDFRMEDGWRKVDQGGGSFVTAVLYNINTGEIDGLVVRDYEYEDCSRDNDYWYDAPIDEVAYRAYCYAEGIIIPGMRVMVVKGRKIEHGYVGTVLAVRPILDKYRRHICDYVIFVDGKKTNVDNVIIIRENENNG